MQNEPECAYYLRTRQCKFGNTCKYVWLNSSTNFGDTKSGLVLRRNNEKIFWENIVRQSCLQIVWS